VLGTGAGVPTLPAVLETVPCGLGVNVELKEDGTAVDALEVVAGSSAVVWISSFAPSVLAACRTVDPAVPRAYLTAEGGRPAVQTALQHDCTALHPAADCCTERLVDRAHDADLSVTAWTVASRSTARSLAARGVDGVIADRPDVWPVAPG